MNLTEELEKKIQADQEAAAERAKAENRQIIYDGITRNPWSGMYLNITRQVVISQIDPKTAQVLKDFKDCTPDKIFPMLPKSVRESFPEMNGGEE